MERVFLWNTLYWSVTKSQHHRGQMECFLLACPTWVWAEAGCFQTSILKGNYDCSSAMTQTVVSVSLQWSDSTRAVTPTQTIPRTALGSTRHLPLIFYHKEYHEYPLSASEEGVQFYFWRSQLKKKASTLPQKLQTPSRWSYLTPLSNFILRKVQFLYRHQVTDGCGPNVNWFPGKHNASQQGTAVIRTVWQLQVFLWLQQLRVPSAKGKTNTKLPEKTDWNELLKRKLSTSVLLRPQC